MNRRSYFFRFLLISLVLILLFVADVALGSSSISFAEIFSNLLADNDHSIYTILWHFRLPKAMTCVLAGSSLACGGLLMQTLFRNPLAGPDVLGLSSGASLAVGILVLIGRNFEFSSNEWTLALAASIGGMSVLLIMLLIARTIRDNTSLLIIGLMLAAATSSIMSVMQFVSRAEDLQFYILWTMGSVGNTNWNEIVVLAAVLFIGVTCSFVLLKPLNSWLLGENYARSLGINVSKSRLWIVVITGLMTGAITAFCGPIAFVGLAVPHLARLVIPTTNHKILIPMVMCGGALLLLFCDVISQLTGSTQSLPLNALTSLIGAPVVIWQVMRVKKISI